MAGTGDPYDLQRFVDAQEPVYDAVISELTGRQETQPLDLVRVSAAARARQQPDRRPIRDFLRLEAVAYLAHEVLGPRLRECTRLVAQIDGRSVEEIFGWPDYLKVRSSMTLFARSTNDNADFVAVLDKFYGGEQDPVTVEALS